jgi:hypothetical protein
MQLPLNGTASARVAISNELSLIFMQKAKIAQLRCAILAASLRFPCVSNHKREDHQSAGSAAAAWHGL